MRWHRRVSGTLVTAPGDLIYGLLNRLSNFTVTILSRVLPINPGWLKLTMVFASIYPSIYALGLLWYIQDRTGQWGWRCYAQDRGDWNCGMIMRRLRMILLPRRKLKINQNGAQASPLGLSTSIINKIARSGLQKSWEMYRHNTIFKLRQSREAFKIEEQRGANIAISSACNRPLRKRDPSFSIFLSESVLS